MLIAENTLGTFEEADMPMPKASWIVRSADDVHARLRMRARMAREQRELWHRDYR